MKITVGARTDTGTRDNNEDSYAVLTNHQGTLRADAVLIVADGMGGRAYGEKASSNAVDSVRATLSELLAVNAPEQPPIQDALATALRRANSLVYDMAAENPGRQPMGTTCTTAVIAGDKLFIGHVGDSRAYLLRDDILRPITSDHSFVAEQMRQGHLSDHDARRSRFRNVITRAVGIEPTIQPDIEFHVIKDGDVILVCTDGLTGMIDEAGITQILFQSRDAQVACDYLVEAAKRAGGKDNISALVAFVGEPVLVTPKAPPARPVSTARNGADKAKGPRQPRTLTPAQKSEAAKVSEESGSARAEKFLDDIGTESQPRRMAPLAGVVLFIAGLVVGALLFAAFLVSGHVVQTVSRAPYLAPYEKPVVKPAAIDLATVNYAAPAPLLYKPLRADFLQQAPGGLLVMTTQGRLLLASTSGQLIRTYPGSFAPTPTPTPAPTPGQAAPPAAPKPAAIGVAADRQGDLYRADPAKRALDKFGPDGKFQRTIDAGELTSPGTLAVSDNGDIFVVDNGRLMFIKALPSASVGKQ